MVRKRLRLGSMLVLAGISLGAAQERMALTVEDAVRVGLENSKAIHASLMRVNYADAKSAEVTANRLPSLKFLGAYTRLSDVPAAQFANPFASAFPTMPAYITLSPTVENNYNLRLSLQQPLFTGFRLSAASSAADNIMEATSEEYSRDRAGQVYAVKAAYWSLFKASELKKVYDENVDQITAHLKDVQSMMDQGMATTNDVLKVQVQLSDARLRQIDAENNVRIAMVGLDNAIGLPLSTQVDLTSPAAAQPHETAALQELLVLAMDRRPDLRAMQYQVKAGEDGVTAARSGWWPQVYLSGNYYYQRPNSRIFPTVDLFKNTWDVSLSINLDIWNWGTTLHQSDQAQAQVEQARDALSQMKDMITLDVTQAYLNLQQARERIDVASQGVKQAEENLRVTKQRYDEGLALNSDVLDADVALLQARTSATQTVVDYALAEARLQKSVGDQESSGTTNP